MVSLPAARRRRCRASRSSRACPADGSVGFAIGSVGIEEQPAGVELEERRLPVGVVHRVADDAVAERVGRVLAEPVMPNVDRDGCAIEAAGCRPGRRPGTRGPGGCRRLRRDAVAVEVVPEWSSSRGEPGPSVLNWTLGPELAEGDQRPLGELAQRDVVVAGRGRIDGAARGRCCRRDSVIPVLDQVDPAGGIVAVLALEVRPAPAASWLISAETAAFLAVLQGAVDRRQQERDQDRQMTMITTRSSTSVKPPRSRRSGPASRGRSSGSSFLHAGVSGQSCVGQSLSARPVNRRRGDRDACLPVRRSRSYLTADYPPAF